jgi:CTLH/CRA C-terminal to LisH motif domain
MYDILQAIRAKNLAPAIRYFSSETHANKINRWADKKRLQLEQRTSDLSFDLHRLQFIQLFNSGNGHPAPQALAYAQANFPSFQQRHLKGLAPISET